MRDLLAVEAATGKERWRRKVIDAGGGALGEEIVVVGNVVAVGDENVYAFRVSDGTPLWQRSRPSAIEGSRRLATDGRYFYLASWDGRLSKVDPLTGEDVWVRSLHHGDTTVVAFAPSVHGSRVYVCANRYIPNHDRGSLSAFDTESGERLWRFDYEPHRSDRNFTLCFSPVAAVGGSIVSAVIDGRIIAHDPTTGVVRWTSPSEQARDSTGDIRYVSSDGQALIAISTGTERVTRLNPVSGEVLWRSRTPGGPLAPAQLGAGAALVTHQPPVVAYDLATGAVLWTRPSESEYGMSTSPPYRVFGAPLVHDGVAYISATDGFRAKRIR